MAELANNAAARAAVVILAGRIEGGRSYDGKWYTRIALPAADEYSKPGLVEVESEAKLGAAGDNWKGACEVSGFGRQYETKDGDKVKTATNVLRVVAGR